ncbi:MAG: hypothetical protein ACOY90_10100 [Candidatus Zhuqueibacterota bacterium]
MNSSIELKNIFNDVIIPGIRLVWKKTAAQRQQEFNKLTLKPGRALWLLVKFHTMVYKTASLLHIDDEMIVVAEKYQ